MLVACSRRKVDDYDFCCPLDELEERGYHVMLFLYPFCGYGVGTVSSTLTTEKEEKKGSEREDEREVKKRSAREVRCI